ncbi:MAG: hypothetical protein LUE64_01105 [Candidatus Gastranaerophilales bacterium]|nr:hypothetical protein [Candidatus Gastranaerophilales bacterium]
MTIPSVLEHHQKQEAAAGLKKMYSSLMQAASLYQAESGFILTDIDTQSMDIFDFMKEYFEPYLNIMRLCDSFFECYNGKTVYNMDNTVATENSVPFWGAVLSDGSFLGAGKTDGGIIFYFDVNGSNGNNTVSRDIFSLYLVNQNTLGYSNTDCAKITKTLKTGIYPGGYASCYVPHATYSRDELLGTSIHRACNKNALLTTAGVSTSVLSSNACAAVIMKDDWQIKSDYPW